MALHDRYARRTPYELAFPDPGQAQEFAAAVREEAGGAGSDPRRLSDFMGLAAVTGFLRELRGPDVGGEAIHRYAVLAHQALLFHRAHCPLYLLELHAARYLVDGVPGRLPALPTDAGYLQLPQHLFWVASGEDGTPESVDGLFWNVDPSGTLYLLLALGLRGDRPGLAVVPVAEAPWADAPGWIDAQVRPDARDFATTLPGGELDHLHSFVSAGEALKLFARVWAHAAEVPGAVGAPDRAPDAPPEGEPRPTRLTYRRIRLD